MLIKKNLLLVCLSLFLINAVSAQKTFKYIGATKCKMCHNKPTKGEQYNVWLKNSHANAFKSLSSQKSLDVAKKLGISDPTTDAKCLKCHSTFDMADEKLRAGIKQTEGVSCESCHGAGSNYKSPTIMKNQKLAMASGLIMPTKEVCISCHNEESPTFVKFDYEASLAKIAHPNPTAK